MRISWRSALFVVIAGVLLTGSSTVLQAAADTPHSANITINTEPARYTFVSGDASKWRALHWMNDGYVGGLQGAESEFEIADDIQVETEGHAIPNDGDYSALVSLKKEDVGYLIFDYTQFRKYFGQAGGFYRPFRSLNDNYTDRELELNIGRFGVAAGLTLKNLPDIDFLYEREFKQGTKSRLSWTTVTDLVNGVSTTRKTGPAWQEVDEIVDSFTIKTGDSAPWFDWKAQQYWEAVRSRNMREEAQLSAVTPGGASDSNLKIRDQNTDLRANQMATTLGVDRWLWKETAYVSSGYRFAQLTSRELENIFEYDQNRVLTNFSFPEQVRDAHSDNLLTSNTWVGSFMTTLWKPLTVITRMKAEAIGRNSQSTYPKDNSPSNNNGTQKPDGVVDQIDVSENQEHVDRLGESVSLRYAGIPRVALYNEYEFEQTRSNLYEDRRSVSSGEVFNRQDIAHLYRAIGTLGAQWSPWHPFTVTMQGRHRIDDVDYNHVRYSDATATGAKSVFVDAQNIISDEASARAVWKPCRWFQPAFRYQLMDKRYETRGLPNSDVAQTSTQLSNIYTADVTSQPLDDLLLTASASFQDGRIITPARESTLPVSIPTFDFDVFSTLFSAELALTKDVVLVTSAQYTRADNFNDFSSVGMPFGADFHMTDIITSVRWSPKKDITIEPKYGYYQYRGDEDAEVGNYNAHMITLEIKALWG